MSADFAPPVPMTRAARPLTPRQMRFVDEYMIDLNAAAAARRAGYSARRARAQGYELRNTPRINAEIRARMAELSFSTRIQVERVAVELGRAAFANPQGLVSKDGRLLELEELDPDFAQVMRAETRKDPKGGRGCPEGRAGWGEAGARVNRALRVRFPDLRRRTVAIA